MTAFRKSTAALFFLGTFFVLPPVFVQAGHRIHDPEVETKVTTDQRKTTVEESGRKSLRERIEAILHPETIKSAKPAPVSGVLGPVDFSNHEILGLPMATQSQCVEYLLNNNPYPAISVSAQDLVAFYYEEGEREGVRPDVAFAQALKETGFFRYGGTVTPDQNNYCGLGTTSATVKGMYFPSARMGVRAHIQHLLAYASTKKPVEEVVDPRYELVRDMYGHQTLNTWTDLNGRWAVPGYTYGQSIMSMFHQILQEP